MAAKKSPFITTKVVNGVEKQYDNANQGRIYPRFQFGEGWYIGDFNHVPSGKTLPMLMKPAGDGKMSIAVLSADKTQTVECGELTRFPSGKEKAPYWVGKLGDVDLALFQASNEHGHYFQVRPDTRAKEREENNEQLAAMFALF